MPSILPRFSAGIKELLELACELRHEDRVYFSSFPRFGFSGAKLFLLCFGAPENLPFLFKIAPIVKAREERNAVRSLENAVRECSIVGDVLESGDWGGLLYAHVGTDKMLNAEKSRSLREILFCKEEEFSRGELCEVIDGSYVRLSNAHNQMTWRECPLEEVYGRYFRKDRSKDRIVRILGKDCRERHLDFLGASILNPLAFREMLPSKIKVPLARVHGDFHPDNVILDDNNSPRLIDFAWAEPWCDALVDFVLMETSIRFRDFPRSSNLAEQLAVDNTLLDEDGGAKIERLSFSDETNRAAALRLGQAVTAIRRRAKSLLNADFNMERYLLAQFILLYGLLQYEQYDCYIALRALGMIAARLNEIGLQTLEVR